MAPDERGPQHGDAIDRIKKDDISGQQVQRGEGGQAPPGDHARPDALVDGKAPSSGGVPQDAVKDLPVRSDPMHDPEIKEIYRRHDEVMAKFEEQTRRGQRPADPEGPSDGPIADIKTTPGERPPTADLPRTQEKPGTGAKVREHEPPPPRRERPTGQITDESGEYGPERTWYGGDGETDWNKMNRAPAAKPARTNSRALIGAAAIFAAVALTIAVVRPGANTTPSSSAPPATSAPTAAVPTEPSGPSAQTAGALGYQCVGNQRPLFDNSNGFGASNGAAVAPSFDTGGKPYCLVSMSTYHWNEGKGAAPGRLGLVGSGGNVGPVQAQGTSGQGGAQNVNWVYVPDAAARPLLQGSYTCYDSDRTTWSQNDASNHAGFCRVFVLDAVKQ